MTQGKSKFPSIKKKFWKSIKSRFVQKSTSTAECLIATAPESDFNSDNDSLINLSPVEVTSKTFVCLSSSADVQMDPIEPEPPSAPPFDQESNKTLVAHNKSHWDTIPPPLITLDSPGNADEPRAVIKKNTGAAEATVANLLHLLHRPPFFHRDDKPCPVKMCRATAKDTSIAPVAKSFLQIPAITLLGWTEVECHCSPRFNATLLNEQEVPLKATERKSDCSGLTVDKSFDEHPDHL